LPVRIRLAKKEDKAPLMEFIKHVWGGHDYLPYVWDDWLKEKGTRMNVVEVDGRVVGMNRLRLMPDGTGWLEGVRIHPDYRGRGLAGMLGERSMRDGARTGVTRYRLTSNVTNRTAHRQVAKLGMKELSRINTYGATGKARFRPQKSVRVAKAGEAKEVLKMVRATKEFKLGSGVYWDAFATADLNEKTVRSLVADGSVLLTEGAVAVYRIGGEGGQKWRQICFLGGEPEAAATLVKHAYGVKEPMKTSWRMAYIPRGSGLQGALKKAGMKRRFTLVLFGMDYRKSGKPSTKR
jgi:GNAT superfamily N-acetyltransferase